MNYRKLTLLIALSIVIVFAATVFLSPSEEVQVTETPQTMETEDPFPSTTTSTISTTTTTTTTTRPANKYETAEYIWEYFKSLGWSNTVVAGIMGNLMSEVGGQTLDIQYWLYGKGNHYGMCQWALKYYPEVEGADLDAQLEFLKNNIEYEINTFGYKYKKGFNYNQFLALENEREAALAFAKTYERCGGGGYTRRQNNATKAYNYFVG